VIDLLIKVKFTVSYKKQIDKPDCLCAHDGFCPTGH